MGARGSWAGRRAGAAFGGRVSKIHGEGWIDRSNRFGPARVKSSANRERERERERGRERNTDNHIRRKEGRNERTNERTNERVLKAIRGKEDGRLKW